MLQVGDWVTQYSAGFWQVVAIYPKFADDDYQGEKVSWKKGDRLGDWAILKKGLTPKMKFSNLCECVDAKWCKKVSDDQKSAIDAAFAVNPKAKLKFDKAPSVPQPYVAALWMDIPEERVREFTDLLASLPERFTDTQFREVTANFKQYEHRPPAGYVLYLFSYPWEMDENGNMLHFGPELKKYQ